MKKGFKKTVSAVLATAVAFSVTAVLPVSVDAAPTSTVSIKMQPALERDNEWSYWYQDVAVMQGRDITTNEFKWGIIGVDGNVRGQGFAFEYLGEMRDGFSPVRMTNDGVTTWGFINMQGEFPAQAVYQPIYKWVSGFSRGLAAVQDMETERWGFINTTGQMVIPPTYSDIDLFEETGYTCVSIINENTGAERWGLVNSSGRMVLDCRYRDIAPVSEDICKIQAENGKYGYYNVITERMVVTPLYDEGGDFKEGMARVRLGNMWGFINTSGTAAINYTFGDVKDFSQGLAAVKDYNTNKWGHINKRGEDVVSRFYDDVGSFKHGAAPCRMGTRWGAVGLNGSLVVPCENLSVGEFNDGLAKISTTVQGKFGFIKSDGNMVVNAMYDSVTDFEGGLSKVRIGDNYGLIDTNGTLVLNIEYGWIGDFTPDVSRYAWIWSAAIDRNGIIEINWRSAPPPPVKCQHGNTPETCTICNAPVITYRLGRVRGTTNTIEVADAIQILMYLAKNPQSVINTDAARAKLAADINEDGFIRVDDAVQILMYLAKNPSCIIKN